MPKLSRKHDNFAWMQFFPEDWRSDNGIAMCSAEARGIWIEILCCMWNSNMRGVIVGDTIALARLTRSTVEEVQRAVAELEKYCVLSRGKAVSRDLPEDSIVNRRMYREWCLSMTRSESGRRGGEVGGSVTGDTKARPGNTNAARDKNATKTQRNAKQNAENAKQTQSKTDFVSDSLGKAYGENAKQNANDTQSNSLGRSQKPEAIEDLKPPIPPADGESIGPLAGMLRGLMGGLTSGEERGPGRLHPAKAAEVEELTQRCAGTSTNPAATAWWAEVLARYAENGGCLRDVHDLLAEVLAGQTPTLGKDVGRHTDPQRWLRTRMTKLLVSRGLRWPKMPEEQGSTQRAGQSECRHAGGLGKTPHGAA